MGLVDFILNVAGLLLWLNWRSLHFDPLLQRTPATLAGTLRPAEPQRWRGWKLLAALVLLLGLRAALYWEVCSAVEWTPTLDLGVVALAFRSDSLSASLSFDATLLFSVLSFLRLTLVFYFWLLVLTLINRPTIDPDPIQKIIRQHIGPLARWPWPVLLGLPFLASTLLWLACYPGLTVLDVVNHTHSWLHVAEQGLLVGAGFYISLKYLLPTLLLAHLITSYVYLGSGPLWDFITSTARNLLRPLRTFRYAGLDFAPVAGILLILALCHWLPNIAIHRLLRSNFTLWPQ